MNKIKVALALIVKPTDDEANLLKRCLDNVSQHVDGIFVTITGENALTEEVCKDYKANISHFTWVNDFAAARNFNFSQVPKDYTHILWCDADDVFRGLKNLKPILKQYSDVDVFSVNYLYHFNEYKQADVVHMKTQIVKNDGCVEWAGALHEDFKENRAITRYFIQDIERLHLTDEDRIVLAKTRNVEVSLADLEKNPNDPRSYWNLGNSYLGAGKYVEAKDTLQKFVDKSTSSEEKYLAYINLSRICEWTGDRNKAIEYGRIALGLKPEYPDAYHNLGQIYYNKEDYREAEKLILMGLTMKPPYKSIIVFNPRDYDFTPLMLLSKVYYQLSRPDQAVTCIEGCLKIQPGNTELKKMLVYLKSQAKIFETVVKVLGKAKKLKSKKAIKKLIDELPEDLQSHPGICNLRNIHFQKTGSTGKDIVYFCGFTEEEWTPDTAKTKGIGGSEEAVIWLTSMWAKQGYNVTVYNNCGHKEKVFDGVTYKPFWSWNYRDKQDVVIVWRNPGILKHEINAPIVLLDMHDVIPEGEMSPERIARASKIMVKSKYQRDLYKSIPDDKFIIVPNGIDAKLFDVVSERDNNLIINTSAPNRGIYILTHMFREIKKRHPEARLQWAYGWTTFNNGFRDNAEVMQWREKLENDMKEIGVEILGRLSHGDVAKLYLKAGIWAYPSGFGEIDCISLSKAMAAGAFPVTTDFAALGEKQGHGGHFIHSDITSNNWLKPNQHDFSIIDEKQVNESIDAVVHYLKNPPTEEARKEMRKWAQETFDWNRIFTKWNEVIELLKK